MIDTHCHIEEETKEEIKQIVLDNFNSNIKYVVVSGYNKESNNRSIKLSKQYNSIYSSIGYNPNEIKKTNLLKYFLLKRQLKYKKVIAIGEIGLDYYRNKENISQQKKHFIKQIKIAKCAKLPIVIHCREAYGDLYAIIKKYPIKGIVHCFTGNVIEAKKLTSLGLKLGIGGIITFKDSLELNAVVKELDIVNFVLETDAPYLSPVPKRGEKNKSSNIIYVANKIAEIKNMNLEDVKSITSKTASEIFDSK